MLKQKIFSYSYKFTFLSLSEISINFEDVHFNQKCFDCCKFKNASVVGGLWKRIKPTELIFVLSSDFFSLRILRSQNSDFYHF